ncbi:MAG TPA: lamin tail domain-containing protein [Flexivirga sp.]|uniref:lamin tail domain-containing protein n=1 Tax=Flexivirga sp. TaxID=1962927 RepID=UPI002BC5784B|nr:lamin tail domain-containing protein [Flexivirga sp.]HWC23463.1 lamin tail domain-containing protein [Flexivirga sp.]
MRPVVPVLAAASLAIGMTLPLAAPADAATTLKFARFYADQPGADMPYTNTRLNNEYVQVKNVTRKTISLSGYTIRDRGYKHTYRFPSTFRLGAGKTVTVHTGKGRNTSANLYWGMRSMAWNNGTRAGVVADTAYLFRSSSKVTYCNYIPTAAQLRAKTGYRNC